MGTPAYSFPYQPYTPPTTPGGTPPGYTSTTDPRKLAENQRQLIASQGNQYQQADQQRANQYLTDASGTQAYLNPIENTLATGGGGYNPAETSQIELSPQDKQNIITGAGITAGGQTASAVGAAERATAASGGNPAALAAYRARAAQTGGAQAADAMTQARIAAKQQEAAGATNVGGARLAQQGQGLQYFGGLQGQQTQTGLEEQGLGQGAYGTETSGTNAAADTGLKASQTPSTFDKIIGGVSGAVSALADGRPPSGVSDYLSDGIDAVVAEDGPEMVVEKGSAHPQQMMDDGGPALPGPYASQPQPMQGMSLPPQQPGFMSRYLANSQRAAVAPGGGQPAGRPWSPVDTYSSAGQAVGTGIKNLAAAGFLADGDGGMYGGGDINSKVITSPTHMKLGPNDQVIPLSFRPKAKIRPSAALPAMAAAQRQRPMFGARV